MAFNLIIYEKRVFTVNCKRNSRCREEEIEDNTIYLTIWMFYILTDASNYS